MRRALPYKLLVTAGSTMAFAAFVSAGTLAVFSDAEAVGANAFTTGKIDLGVSPASAAVSFSGMMPGDQTTSALVVTNGPGSSALRYAVSSAATDADGKTLKDGLVLTVRTIDATTPASPCDDFDGTQLYTGDLDSTAGKIVGDAAQGAQSGDRSLAPGASETLCFRVALPLAASNSYANASTTATFTFDAEQTVNNP